MMMKYRVHEVAKDLNVPNKFVIDLLQKYCNETKKHMTALTEEELDLVLESFTQSHQVKSLDGYFADNQPEEKEPVMEKKQEDGKRTQQNKRQTSRPAAGQKKPQEGKPAASGNHNNNNGNGKGQKAQSQQRPQQPKQQQPVAKTQAPVQDHSNTVQRPVGRLVDTRASNVDIERYNEKYDRLASEKVRTDNTVQKQKINQRSQRRGKPRNSRKETEAERLRRIALERKTKPITVQIPDEITVGELAMRLKATAAEVIKKLMMMGTMATVNDVIDFDTASLVAMEFHAKVEKEVVVTIEERIIDDSEDDDTNLVPRAPVVVVMGHVDHGKTSLLDAIRHANVTASEAGGITQHIGAYQVNYQGKKIVFLDTPGHEAFTAMRARGAQVTDVAILVVAADDGVMPQTLEAINHAKAAKVPIIVAINKMDRPGANPDHVKQQLAEHELIPEDWGGDTIMVPVSAHQKTGISELLEMILLVAEMQDLKANPSLPAHGTIIEAQLDKGRGPVATVLVQRGTLQIGDTIIAGTAYGKVRAMVNDRGEKVKKALPSTPVEVLGLNDVPLAGDILDSTDEKIARSVAEKRVAKKRIEEIQQNSKVSLDDLFQRIQEGEIKDLNIVVKADVQGTIEALRSSLQNIKNDEVKVVVVHAGVGAITESDVMLASAANALIIGFNVRPDANARKAAEAEKVDVRTYRVIYDALNDVEAAIKGMLAPKFQETIQGRVEVRQMITISKMLIAGCYVLEGKITNTSKVRVVRDGIVINEDEIDTLRRFKDDVKEVAAGYECGVTLEKFRDLKEGDVFEVFTMEEVAVE